MKNWKIIAVQAALFIVALLVAQKCLGASFTLGAGSGSEADCTYLNETASGTNYGSVTTFWMGGGPSSGADAVALLSWPAIKDSVYGRTIDACSLWVKPSQANDNVDGLYAMYQIRSARDWVEGQATWTDFKTSNAWTTAGARSTTSDIFSTAVASKVEADFTSGVYTAFDITSIATQWDGNDTANCRGVALKQFSGTDPTQIRFHSDDAVTSTNRPKIKVVYHEGIDATMRKPLRRKGQNRLGYKQKIETYCFAEFIR